MSSPLPTLKKPRISAISDDVSGPRKATEACSFSLSSFPTSLSSSTLKIPDDKLFTKARSSNQKSQADREPKILLDFRKLPEEVVQVILDILERDAQTAALSSLARSNRKLYRFANSLVYRNIRLRDLASGYFLLCTLFSNADLGMFTQSLYSNVQWFNHHPFQTDVAAVPQWRNAAAQKIMTGKKFTWEGMLSPHVFQSWHSITAMLLLYLPNLRVLHLPRYFEAVDRGMNEAIVNIPSLVRWIAEIHQKMLEPGHGYPEDRVPLKKLHVLNLLPDSAEGWNHFRARPLTTAPCISSLQPFLRLRSIKVMRTVLDDRVAPMQYLPVGTPNVNRKLTEEGAVRLGELELVSRWIVVGGAHDYLGPIV
ncbi:hypothetical protein BKA64DRAFT_266813 [Cadophora sp. MPI-SDFR-AT-0126]|nr:hypothetical protein BKA64DRAFT_266813 [Leotiomycetes sp. MPI-SDFR-AT-0126]